MEHISVKELTKIYSDGTGTRKVLDNISFDVHKKEKIAVVGASGSGKSTLLNVMSTTDNFDKGSLKISGIEIGEITDRKKSRLRLEKMGFVFQKYCLIQTLSAYDNIVLPILAKNRNVDEEYVDELIKKMGIEHIINKYPCNMSGGEQQRVAIARAMVKDTPIIVADEPTGNLDSESAKEVLEIEEAVDNIVRFNLLGARSSYREISNKIKELKENK